MRLRCRFPVGIAVTLLVWASLSIIGVAQDELEDSSEPESTAVREDEPSPLLIPNWRGRTPRWIGMYGSQIADLVPEDYRPISIDELVDAIQAEAPQSSVKSEIPVSRCLIFARLVNPAADDPESLAHPEARIVSLSTELTLPSDESDSDLTEANESAYHLGPVNFAIQPPPLTDDERPTFACGPDGDLFAIGRAGERLDLNWSLRSELGTRGREWNMRLPNATTTDFFLSVDVNDVVEVEGGTATVISVSELKAKHPERKFDTTIDQKWVRIEPIPGRWIFLSVRDQNATAPYRDVVRGCRITATCTEGQLRWTARLTIDRRTQTPTIDWANGEIHSLQRDGTPIPLEWSQPTERATDLRAPIEQAKTAERETQSAAQVFFSEVSLPRASDYQEDYFESGIRRSGSSVMQSSTMVLTYEGITPFNDVSLDRPIQLPIPILPKDRFFIPPQVWQLQVEVASSFVLTQLSLPSQWNVSKSDSVNSQVARNLVVSNGVVTTTPGSSSVPETDASAASVVSSNATWMSTGPVPQPADPWSFSVAPRNAPIFSKHQVRFEMDETSIETRAKITVDAPAGSLRPILLELQDGFQFEFVGAGNARRNVTAQIKPGRGRRLTIWPVAGEAVDGQFVIYANARSRRGAIEMNNEARIATQQRKSDDTQPKNTRPQQEVTNKSSSASEANAAPLSPGIESVARNETIADDVAKSSSSVGEVSGSEPKPILPPLWLIRVQNCPGQLLASIIPPTNLSWTAKAAIEPNRIDFAELTAEQRRFFAPLPGDAIVFGGAIESTPPLELENPDVDLAVSVRTSVQLAPDVSMLGSLGPINTWDSTADSSVSEYRGGKLVDPNFVYQTFEFKTEGTSGSISAMKIRFAGVTGEVTEMPPMEWSIQIRPGEREVPISGDQVTKRWNDAIAAWEISVRLPTQHSNQSLLIARSRQQLPQSAASSNQAGSLQRPRAKRIESIRIGLPNVPDAASQIAEVIIAPELRIARRDESLIGVPVCRYRYGTDDQPWVDVARRDFEPPKVLVVQETLRSCVSVSGADMLKLNCLTRTESDLQLDFPRSLRLIEVRVDGRPVDTRVLPGVGVIVPITVNRPESTTESSSLMSAETSNLSRRWVKLEAKWVSSSSNDRWSRWYTFPKISLNEMTIGSQQNLVLGPGTSSISVNPPFIFGKLFGWLVRVPNKSSLDAANSADSAQPTATLLVPTVIVNGIGWIAAILLLGLARLVGRRGLTTIGVGVMLAMIAGVLWPTSIAAMVALVALPLTIAALQISASGRNVELDPEAPPFLSDGEESGPRTARVRGWRQATDEEEPYGESWTRRIQTPQKTKPGSVTESRSASSGDSPSEGDDEGESDFSSSALLPITLALVLASVSNVTFAQTSFSQPDTSQPGYSSTVDSRLVPSGADSPQDAANGQAEQRPVEVLVPLRKDGSVLGDKIYVPEEFYNELFFEDLGLKVHEALIHRADYRLRLRSINSLDFAMPVQGAAALTVDLAFRRPGSLVRQSTVGPSSRVKSQHRVRLPYQATDVEDVQPIAGAGETSVFQSRRSVRHGRDEKGWLWVEIPDTDIIEIRLTLRCSIETIQQWVTVNAALPSLAVSTLTVQAERRVSSIVLQSPSDSSVGKTGSPSTPFANQLITTDLASTVDPFAYDSQTISLGNLPQLIVRFRVDEQDASAMPWNQPEQWKTRYWVYVQPGETAVECELESLTDLPSQTTVKLSLTNKNVEFLSDGWQLAPEHERVEGDGADQDPAAVPQIELIRHAGRAQPIRLGWKIKTTESGEPITLSLPRVQVGELTSQDDFLSLEPALFNTADNRAPENIDSRARPWIAFSFSKQVQPDWTRIDARAPLSVEPLAIDKFYSQWKGYLKSIDRSLTGDIRELTYQPIPQPRSQWLTRHEILIGALEQRIKYIAEVKPPPSVRESDDLTQLRYSIELPNRARLLNWRYASSGDDPVSPSYSVDEADDLIDSDAAAANPLAEASWEIVRLGNKTWLYFDAPVRGFVIEVDAVVPNTPPSRDKKAKPTNREQLRLGHLKLDRVSQPTRSAETDDLEQVHDFRITRTKDVNLQWVRRSDAEQMLDGFEDAAALLTAGEVLVDRFTIDQPIHDSTDMATYRVRPINLPFDLDSRITLRWEEGRWMAQMDCHVTSKHCPDFVDVAIPTRWCDSLQVEPLCVSSRQPTLDPALQVMRIELRPVSPETEEVRTFRLKSRLAVSEIARVTVPEIDVLNARRHRIDVVVPTRLTNEQVRWRSNFAGPIEKPRWSVESPMRMPEDSALSVYAVTAPTWSIDLEALPRTDRRAKCLHADHKVVVSSATPGNASSQTTYIISRFDVLPGDQSSVQLSLSRSTKLIGVWTATQASDLRLLPPTDEGREQFDLVRYEIPLPLNRLSQTIEIVTAMDRPFSEVDACALPQLEGLSAQDSPATVAWCEVNGLNSNPVANHRFIESPLTPADRHQLLASSVVRAIASSSDALADRRDEEVATWLLPWISRYRMLARSVGHELGNDASADPDLDSAGPGSEENEPTELDRKVISAIEQVDIDRDGIIPWVTMDRFILNQEERYFSTDDDFLESSEDRSLRRLDVRRASMWTDFLSVSNPPGYTDRWTFLWTAPTLPFAELGRNRSVMAETTRQNVLRTGLFLALAAFLFISFVMTRNESPSPNQEDSEQSIPTDGAIAGDRIMTHPAVWLVVLALIGLPVVPLLVSAGLLLVTAVLVSIDPGYPALARWRRT